MDLGWARGWMVLLHILATFGFLAVHGISMGVAFRIRQENDRERIRTLLQLSSASLSLLGIFGILLILSGIVAGIVGGWWTNGQLWLWASIVVLVLVLIGMYVVPSTYFEKLRRAVGLETRETEKKGIPVTPASDEELAALIVSGRPYLAAAIGVSGLIVITYLMVLKPF